MKDVAVFLLCVLFATTLFSPVFARTKTGTGIDPNEQVARRLAFEDALGQIASEIECHVIATFDHQITSLTFSASEQIFKGTTSSVSVHSSVRLRGIQSTVVDGYPKRRNGQVEYRMKVSVPDEYIDQELHRAKIRQKRNRGLSQFLVSTQKRKIYIVPEIRIHFDDPRSRYEKILQSSLALALKPDKDGLAGFYSSNSSIPVHSTVIHLKRWKVNQLKQGHFVITGAFDISRRDNPPRIVAEMSHLRIESLDSESVVDSHDELSQVLATENSIGAFIKEFGLFAGQKIKEDLFELLSQQTYVFEPAYWDSSHRALFVDYLKSFGHQTEYYRAPNLIIWTGDSNELDHIFRALEAFRFSEGAFFEMSLSKEFSNYGQLRANRDVFKKYGRQFERWIRSLIDSRQLEEQLSEKQAQAARFLEKDFVDCFEQIDQLESLQEELQTSGKCKGVKQFVELIKIKREELIKFLPEPRREDLAIKAQMSEYDRHISKLHSMFDNGRSTQVSSFLQARESELVGQAGNSQRRQAYAYYLIGDLYQRAYHLSGYYPDFKKNAIEHFDQAMNVDQNKDKKLKDKELYESIQKSQTDLSSRR
jgi:hypothetical protein